MNNEIIQRLRAPFAFRDVEWKIQVTTQDKARGMAVAYIDSRAIQNRLDEAVGVFNWKNTFEPWQSNSQICGLSVRDAECGEWITKFDGAENTDIEPVKGGLSDSFKRAACVWGIGRYLYELGGIWVEVEQRGKSSVIRDNQYQKLEGEYNGAVNRIFGNARQVKPPVAPTAPTATAGQNTAQPPANVMPMNSNEPISEYQVKSVKPSGKESQLLELMNPGGEVLSAYVRKSDDAIKIGSKLAGVNLVQKQSSYGYYNLINDYRIAA
ncbi:hypothetical protein FACS1894219_08230 [Clostridia bacterium]|nr:hypothetical protein FACS1894219_08230 [Clostridia bacterium]